MYLLFMFLYVATSKRILTKYSLKLVFYELIEKFCMSFVDKLVNNGDHVKNPMLGTQLQILCMNR